MSAARTWSFYDAATGAIAPSRVTCPAGPNLAGNTPAGHVAIEGRFDHLSQRVNLQTGQVEDYQPPAPAADELRTWAWNDATRRWAASPTDAAVAIDVRAERDKRLTACDWVTVRAVELSEEIPTDWLAYRASLRAVPEQPGFPRTIDWPTPPAE
jgi:hypothetical protein